VHIQPFFPIGVGTFQLDKEISKKTKKFINNLEQIKNIGNRRTKNSNVFSCKELKDIELFCKNSLDTYFKQIYTPSDDLSLYVTQSWFNFADKGEFHHIHYHPNSFLSGVFYVDTDPDTDRITFYNPLPKHFRVNSQHYTPFNSRDWWIPVKPGMLVIFPSFLDHNVPCVKHASTRISLAFNSFFKGPLGEPNMLDYLDL
jgi:uncharacterized protein (TIGR02466 family)